MNILAVPLHSNSWFGRSRIKQKIRQGNDRHTNEKKKKLKE